MYFEINDIPETAPSTLWEAFKAYLRGCVISYEATRKKENKSKIENLEKQIQQLDRENSHTPSSDLHRKIANLKYQYNQLLSAKISKAFLYTKQKYFEFGDKPHKLLARQLRKMENDRTIHKIKSNNGTILTKPKDINDRFLQFYSSLYTSECSIMNEFLDKCNLPKLSDAECKALNTKLSITEIHEAITSLKRGKAPGPDGLPSELYKKFDFILSPYLHRMYVQAQEEGTLPPTLTEATIIMIHKKGKDAQDVGSYRPISLLNLDGKLFAKILANRLNPLMNKLVHMDQTGFIPNRNSTFNLRRLYDIMYTKREGNNDLVILALDAEKAIDQIEWPYLFEVLKRFNFGHDLITWIKLLYKNPSARILTNQTLSPSFGLFRGTRQGCPLSAIIFALAIEPLAQSSRLDPQIYGYDTKNTTNKISYADDILLYVTKPQITISTILEKIKLFGTFSGYRINWNKSILMPIHSLPLNTLNLFPFKIATERFTYLISSLSNH